MVADNFGDTILNSQFRGHNTKFTRRLGRDQDPGSGQTYLHHAGAHREDIQSVGNPAQPDREACLRTTAYLKYLWWIRGRLAQLVRAPSSHGGGHWFESSIAHHIASSPAAGWPRRPRGGLAQLGERLLRMQEVTGSSPVSSTSKPWLLIHRRQSGSDCDGVTG